MPRGKQTEEGLIRIDWSMAVVTTKSSPERFWFATCPLDFPNLDKKNCMTESASQMPCCAEAAQSRRCALNVPVLVPSNRMVARTVCCLTTLTDGK